MPTQEIRHKLPNDMFDSFRCTMPGGSKEKLNSSCFFVVDANQIPYPASGVSCHPFCRKNSQTNQDDDIVAMNFLQELGMNLPATHCQVGKDSKCMLHNYRVKTCKYIVM